MENLKTFEGFFGFLKRKNPLKPKGDLDEFDDFFKEIDKVVKYGYRYAEVESIIKDCFQSVIDLGTGIEISNKNKNINNTQSKKATANPILPKDFGEISIKLDVGGISMLEFEDEIKGCLHHMDKNNFDFDIHRSYFYKNRFAFRNGQRETLRIDDWFDDDKSIYKIVKFCFRTNTDKFDSGVGFDLKFNLKS